MKTTLPTGEVRFTNGIDYDYYDYCGLQDDKAHRRQKRREWLKKLDWIKLAVLLLIAFFAVSAAVHGAYRLYLSLFPQR